MNGVNSGREQADENKRPPLSCCGKEAELKTFNTFSYHYCNECKNEVVSAAEKKITKQDVVKFYSSPITFVDPWGVSHVTGSISPGNVFDNNVTLTPSLSEQEQAGLSATMDAFVEKVKADLNIQFSPNLPFYNAFTMDRLDRGIEEEEERPVPEEDPVQVALWKAYRASYLGIN